MKINKGPEFMTEKPSPADDLLVYRDPGPVLMTTMECGEHVN